MSVEPSLLPPSEECNADDIASYQALADSLRSDPRLSEISSSIDTEALAKLVAGIRRFQSKYLGKDAIVRPHWPMVRLPDDIFRNRSPSGPLFTVLSSVFRHKEEKSALTSFDWDSSERYDENVALLKLVEADLLEAGLLQRPAVCFDDSVAAGVRSDLEPIIARFGGTVVSDPRHATHVVAHHDQVDSSQDVQEEKRREEEKRDMEKIYLRTMAVVGTNASAHWWYWPSSYDEWMPAEDVDGESAAPPPRPGDEPWIVSCKFLRDVALFNEWGVEADYAIEDYQDKIQKSSSKRSATKPRKKARVSKGSARKQKDKKNETDAPVPTTTTLDTSLPSTKEAVSPKTPSPANAGSSSGSAVQRDRRAGQGMNPRYILTGFYGARGERLRHMVRDGALRIPSEALDIIENMEESSRSWRGKGSATHPQYELPAIDSVVRPCLDKALGSITVTELSVVTKQVPPPDGVEGAGTTTTQTVAVNHRIDLRKTSDSTIQRIRGGGGGDSDIPERILEGNKDMTDSAPNTGERASAPEGTQPQSAATPAPSQTTASNAAETGGVSSSTLGTTSQTAGQKPMPSNIPTQLSALSDKVPPTDASAGTASDTLDTAPSSGTASSAAPTPALSTAPVGPPAPTASAVQSAGISGVASKSIPTPAAPPPRPTASSTTTTTTTPAARPPQVIPLKNRPASHWEQHKPGAHDEMPQEPQLKTAKPSWYDSDKVSDFERTMLPEWFDDSAPHRTPASYKDVRERIIRMSDVLKNRYVTGTMVRRTIPGDVGSLLRLHGFLLAWGLINSDAVNDSAPTGAGLREESGAPWRLCGEEHILHASFWTKRRRDDLLGAVVEQSNKRQKLTDGSSLGSADAAGGSTAFVPINWEAVAEQVGHGATSVDCEREFLSLPLDGRDMGRSQVERSITPDNANEGKSSSVHGPMDESRRELKEEILRELVDGASPGVAKAATEAALKATGDLAEAQKASLLGIVASQAMERAHKEEDAVDRLLMEVVKHRMMKLENRLALLDDVEGMLEAERVALELERRDLYTARCRHWFGGGT